ncbi:MAG: hypothetical protein N3G20_00030, partial [Verrucomicrobiae bacterium]|nr:hypothetical protein [Verrucomicrobiae bacterium]
MRRIIRRVARQYLVGMLQKRWMVALLAVALGAVCAYKFTDWLSPPTIQILKLDRPVQYGRVSRNVMPVTFTLERRYRLTEVKVI